MQKPVLPGVQTFEGEWCTEDYNGEEEGDADGTEGTETESVEVPDWTGHAGDGEIDSGTEKDDEGTVSNM